MATRLLVVFLTSTDLTTGLVQHLVFQTCSKGRVCRERASLCMLLSFIVVLMPDATVQAAKILQHEGILPTPPFISLAVASPVWRGTVPRCELDTLEARHVSLICQSAVLRLGVLQEC